MPETDTPKHHMDGPTAAKLLEDILRWRLMPWTPVTQIKAIRYDQDIVQGNNDRVSLPFGLDSVIDSVDSDGAAGISDAESIDKALRFWVPWFSDWVGQEPIYRPQPGAWMLQQLQENPVFTNVNGWHLNEDGTEDGYGLQCQTAWDDYCEELKIIHRKVARATGNAPLNRGLCPKCKQGNMQQWPLPKRGYNDEAVCSNAKCGNKIPAEHIPAFQAAALKHVTTTDTDGDIWIYGKQAIELYSGSLTWAHLRDWHKAGKLDRKGKRKNYAYPLAQINYLVSSQ